MGLARQPFIFLLYINDMSALDLRRWLRLFADDSVDFFGCDSYDKNIEIMKRDLEIISEYFRIKSYQNEIHRLRQIVQKHKLLVGYKCINSNA